MNSLVFQRVSPAESYFSMSKLDEAMSDTARKIARTRLHVYKSELTIERLFLDEFGELSKNTTVTIRTQPVFLSLE